VPPEAWAVPGSGFQDALEVQAVIEERACTRVEKETSTPTKIAIANTKKTNERLFFIIS
jgi:hypothetical protein